MKHSLHRIFVVLILAFAVFQAFAHTDTASDEVIVHLQKEAMNSELAWDLLESLSSEVGPRMGGSDIL